MRLVFVHGINNENYSAEAIEDAWCTALETAWIKLGLVRPSDLTVSTVYYATRLAELSAPARRAVEAGAVPSSLPAELGLVREYAEELGITELQLDEAAGQAGVNYRIETAGPPHEAWCIVAATALENILPTRGKYVARCFLRQAAVYLERPGVQDIIKAIVEPTLLDGEGPDVVVAHSLGSVISYEILACHPNRRVPLFVTVGSPLAVRIVSNYVGARAKFPTPPIEHWVNGLDREDFVTLGRDLNRDALGFDGVENVVVRNEGEDKHDIRSYLSDLRIAGTIHSALIGG